jgi:hypothetical protein
MPSVLENPFGSRTVVAIDAALAEASATAATPRGAAVAAI